MPTCVRAASTFFMFYFRAVHLEKSRECTENPPTLVRSVQGALLINIGDSMLYLFLRRDPNVEVLPPNVYACTVMN